MARGRAIETDLVGQRVRVTVGSSSEEADRLIAEGKVNRDLPGVWLYFGERGVVRGVTTEASASGTSVLLLVQLDKGNELRTFYASHVVAVTE